MKKLLSLLGAVSLTATGASSVVACKKPKPETKPETKKGINEEKVKEEKQNLSKLIKTTNLGEITISGGNPTVDELEAAIKAKNPMYKNGDATFTSITATAATATAATDKYIGTVELSYTKL